CSGQANDKDVDGDTYLDPACGGDDCDDLDPLVNPGADEIQDTKDNDCNGLVDEGLIPAGAVIVTEIMKDPLAVVDADGEWFEITNVWVNPVNLHSFDVDDLGSNSFGVNQPGGIVIAPGESAVFCINGVFGDNGGVECDYDFDNFQLGNADDEIILSLDSFEIDRVAYDGGATFPDPVGESMIVDLNAYNATDNDVGGNWCATPHNAAYQLPDGDYGTPGEFNPTCSGNLAVVDVVPDNGIESGGETITIIGAGFTGTTAVQIGGLDCQAFSVLTDSRISCTTPAQAPGNYDVSVTKGVVSETLVSGYRYTGEAGSPAIGWCILQHPPTATTPPDVPTPLIFGRVYSAGVTEPAGPPVGIIGQVGYGMSGSDPRTVPGWLWFNGTWNPSCPDCGNDDEFMETLTVSTTGSYSYAFRFSEDGGYYFVFCDLSPGTADGFSSANLGDLTIE
ncbi:MAG: IPT/TIG domain-containing protein, partial [Deltaproteobacteria bacterium]|nr:IPT/TIG domain-containing protein [Deltaproteobacteria bacterium]